ncbi:hypothetical protein [Methylocaldum sp.]|uniref:hypothetical protein n=1 Tax=Methylocaldum sp. TaxID=1969727 RepID=UPI002D4C31FF|nr:hypothetical protein [Methylocaldum sp.]HYE38197.1 hypothetical protein [Methylocaldum sp.]
MNALTPILPADESWFCEGCGEAVSLAEANAEAFEAYGEIICPSCFDNRCEAAYTAQFEGEPSVSLDEQHRAAWAVKQGLR